MGYNIPHIEKRTIKILDEYKKYQNNDIRQIIAWRFSKNKDYLEGIKYRFAYVHKEKCILRYDNEKAKGHHKHVFDKEMKTEFINISELYKQFIKEVKQLRKILLKEKNEN